MASNSFYYSNLFCNGTHGLHSLVHCIATPAAVLGSLLSKGRCLGGVGSILLDIGRHLLNGGGHLLCGGSLLGGTGGKALASSTDLVAANIDHINAVLHLVHNLRQVDEHGVQGLSQFSNLVLLGNNLAAD